MEKSYLRKQILLLLNQFLIIAYFGYEYLYGQGMKASDIFSLVLILIIVTDAIFIGCMNLKNSKVLSQFSGLLILIAWYFLWSLDGERIFFSLLSFTGVIILYKTIRFVLTFVFQESAYTFQKQTDILLKISCLLTLLAKLINDRWFALLYLFQWVLGVVICLFLFRTHQQRILFVLKSEGKRFLVSAAVLISIFICYVFLFGKQPEYVENLGAYLILFLPLFNIHNIAFKNYKKTSSMLLLGGRHTSILLFSLVCLLTVIGFLMKFSVAETFLILHSMIAFILIYSILLYSHTKKHLSLSNFENTSFLQSNFYMHSLKQIKREEDLKRDFSNYLHDEVLQDLLSVKIMMNKSECPDVRNLIVQALENLNFSIREQMQEYHPAMLKTLTLKENLQNLLDSILETRSNKDFRISFDCDDKLFLVEPYPLIVYRILKELTVNALKHSQGSCLNVTLLQEKGQIELIVQDNGIGMAATPHTDGKAHKGLSSIQEQLALINGSMKIELVQPNGLRIIVQFPMKGEGSYAYFIGR